MVLRSGKTLSRAGEDHAPMQPPPSDAERERALRALATVIDPEIGENIVDLGLVERLTLDGTRVALSLVLTSPTCPMGGAIADDAQRALQEALPGREVRVDEAQDVAWTPQRLSAAARERLGWNDADA
jgi:metal-sulfur cluster biosynthetic enzyme